MVARVLSIARMSVHDGPGIRTTVYLKGCPLHCRWCHNPESISPLPEVGFLPAKCIGCGKCAQVCPTGAHSFHDGEHRFDHRLCKACGSCVEACLPGALEYHGTHMSAEETCEAVLQDRTFYAKSGGGCTLSGGEPLLQPEFCAALFSLLRARRIHCALDTSGAVSWGSFATVLPHTDLFLYDVKHTDADLHRAHTGSSNCLVLANLRCLSQRGVPIEVRIPLIPGFNADPESMTSIAALLAGLPNILGVRLLPYHLARAKYQAVGRPDTMPHVPPPDPHTLAQAAAILQDAGLRVIP